jgi:hypothetical protein
VSINLLKEMTTMARKSVSRWDEIMEESKKGADIWVGVDVHNFVFSGFRDGQTV